MRLHQFVLILDRSPDGDQVDAVNDRHQDLDLWPGSSSVAVQRRAGGLVEAVVSAVRDLEAVKLCPVRVYDADWVALAHIAQRIGRSRELVRQWSIGKSGPGGFPPPVNPGRDIRYYSWAEVSAWLREHQGPDLPDEEPVLAAMNLTLQLRRLARRIGDADRIRHLLTA